MEVVIEAVLDIRPDGHLGAWIELLHRLSQHMGGVMADQLQRLGRRPCDDSDVGIMLDRQVEILHMPSTLAASAFFASPGRSPRRYPSRSPHAGGDGRCRRAA